MKVAAKDADRFVGSPPAAVSAVLVYGPDSGLVRERAETAARAVAGDLSDPFRVVEFTAATLKDDPSRLMDEATALSLTGGRRVVWVRDAGESIADACAAVLAADTGDTLVIVDAGALGARSRLRSVFEQADRGAALACYLDDAGDLETLIRTTLGQAGIAADRDTVSWIGANLGADRAVSRMELEKLVLYAGGQDAVTLADAQAVIGDSAVVTLDDIAAAAGSGVLADLTVALARARFEGINAITVLRAMQRHVTRLEACVAAVAAGQSPEQAIARLRPPVFWKQQKGLVQQVRRWRAPALQRARSELVEAELACKSTGMPDDAVCERALMRIAALAGARLPR